MVFLFATYSPSFMHEVIFLFTFINNVGWEKGFGLIQICRTKIKGKKQAETLFKKHLIHFGSPKTKDAFEDRLYNFIILCCYPKKLPFSHLCSLIFWNSNELWNIKKNGDMEYPSQRVAHSKALNNWDSQIASHTLLICSCMNKDKVHRRDGC